MQNEKCEFAHSSFYSYSPLICSIPICATHLMTTESMGVLLYFYRVNSFRSQIHPTPIFITKRIVGHITWGIVNSLPKTKPERISPGFSEINICCMKFNRIRNLDVHVWPYVTNHAEFTLQMHLFPPVYNPWYMFYLFSNKYWYVSFFQYFILLHVHHGLKLQCTGKKIINTNAWHHNGIPDINIVHKHYERYGDMYTSTYKQAPHMPYLIHKNKFSSISFNAIIIYKITLQLINGKKSL